MGSGAVRSRNGSSSQSVGSGGGGGGRQQYLPSGLNGEWQSDEHMAHRRDMIQHIVRLLKQRDRDASPEWLQKLPQMVKQLEVSLYRSAPSFDAYADTSTLKRRLQQLAAEIARKTREAKGRDGRGGDGDPSDPKREQRRRDQARLLRGLAGADSPSRGGHRRGEDGSGRPQHHRVDGGRGGSLSPSLPPPQSRQGGASSSTSSRRGYDPQHGHGGPEDGRMRHHQEIGGWSSQGGGAPPPLRPHDSSSVDPLSRRGTVMNIEDINPMMAQNPSRTAASSQQRGGSASPAVSFPQDAGPPPGGPSSVPSGAPSDLGAGDRDDPGWRMRVRHKQQRLLLLHHSSKCPVVEPGRCSVTAHCADMKRLWRHMARCTDNDCRVSHCFSSRSILSHYRKCQDRKCAACGPVREIVRKNQHGQVSQGGGSASGMGPYESRGAPSGGDGQGPVDERRNGEVSHRQQSSGGTYGSQGAGTVGRSGSSGGGAMMRKHASPSPIGDGSVGGGGAGLLSSSPLDPAPFRSDGGRAVPVTSLSQRGPDYRPGGSHRSSGSPPSVSWGREQVGSDPTVLPPPSSSRPDPYAGQAPPPPPNSGEALLPSSNDPKIKHKQQRLLLLRHASKCQAEDGRCSVTPYCASMKRLWRHISDCRDQRCPVQHCMSSRYVLSHYRRCRDTRCPACAPVRESIRKGQGGGGGGGGLNQGDGGGMFGDSTRSGGELRPNSLPPAASDARELSDRPMTSIADGDGDGRNVFPSPDQDSHRSQAKRPKIEHSNGASPMEISSSISLPMAGSGSGSDVRGDRLGRGPQAGVFCQSVRSAPPSSLPPSSSNASSSADKRHSTVKDTGADTSAGVPAKQLSDGNHTFSLINTFTVEEIERHVASLDRTLLLPPAKLKLKCVEVLKGLASHQHGWVFNAPVDPEELGLPDYFELIKRPMDLGTIQKRLDSGAYHELEAFATDCKLVFDNATLYNESGSVVHEMAKELRVKFELDYKALKVKLTSEEDDRRKNDRACSLCGREKLLFEPPVFFCNGLTCPSKRIRRNSHYYVGGNNQYHWCNSCYNELDGEKSIELSDATLKKDILTKRKNDEIHEENWVQCDSCQRWIHQICGLFNTRQNREQNSEYDCPRCLLEKAKKEDRDEGGVVGKGGAAAERSQRMRAAMLTAKDLPRTKLSETLEGDVREKVEERLKTLAQEKADAEVRNLTIFTQAKYLGDYQASLTFLLIWLHQK